MGDFTQEKFVKVNTGGCADTTCGRSVIINEDPCPDCCGGGGGGEGPPGPAGPKGPPGPPGPAGRAPLIGCGCLAKNSEDGGSGGPIQQECIDNITGRVVMSIGTVNYFSGNTTSNNFFQYNCASGTSIVCGYFNVTNPNSASPALGNSTGSLGVSSTTTSGDKYIVAWGYIGTGGVPNVNYTWKYGDFKKINGLAADKLTATQGATKFTFMPTDSLFTGNAQIDLGGWKSLITGNPEPSEDLIAAFLNDFPDCATDGTGTPPSPKNGQGGDICKTSLVAEECSCEGCYSENSFPCGESIEAGDIFIDACNKIMYIAGEGGFPANGIPFGPEDSPCPPKEECPDCPDCPEPESCGTCTSPKSGEALQPADWCNCSGALGSLYNDIKSSKCACPADGQLPKCPKECLKTDGKSFDPKKYYYQDPKKECPCNDDGDTAKCPQQCPSDPKSDYYQDATRECPCEEGQVDAGCQAPCPSKQPKICPEDAPGCDTCCPTCPPCNSCCPGGTHGGQQAQAPCTTLNLAGGTVSVNVDITFNCIDGGIVEIDWSLGCVDDEGIPCTSSTGGSAVVIDLPPFTVPAVSCAEANLAGYNSDNSCKTGGCSYYTAADYYEDLYLPKFLPPRVSLNCDGSAFDTSSPIPGAFLGGGL